MHRKSNVNWTMDVKLESKCSIHPDDVSQNTIDKQADELADKSVELLKNFIAMAQGNSKRKSDQMVYLDDEPVSTAEMQRTFAQLRNFSASMQNRQPSTQPNMRPLPGLVQAQMCAPTQNQPVAAVATASQQQQSQPAALSQASASVTQQPQAVPPNQHQRCYCYYSR